MSLAPTVQLVSSGFLLPTGTGQLVQVLSSPWTAAYDSLFLKFDSHTAVLGVVLATIWTSCLLAVYFSMNKSGLLITPNSYLGIYKHRVLMS